ncbi:MAG: BtpA/SgcQ family protein [Erysipelotrichales bacterium]|nr:BtpA/SgcQ family protein [Erysipelotrichales bacterium]
MFNKDSFPQALVMIQPPPMPGSYLNKGETLDDIEKYVMNEAKMIAEMKFDGFILQNMHDGPIAQTARPETIAYMTYLGMKLKEKYPDLTLGILVNWDGVAGLAVADAIKADFLRIEHLYTGVSIDTTGFMFGQCSEILYMKKRLGSSIPIYADVQEVNAKYLCPSPKPEAAKTTIRSAFANGLFMSGNNTTESLEVIKETRKFLPDTPILLGGGATGDNIFELLKYYDGVSVASWIKNGNMLNPIDPERARYFIAECNKAKEWRKKNRENGLW